jgi:hypothetical protein
VFIALALAGAMVACGDDSDEATDATSTTLAATGADAVDITMAEYSYTVGGDLKPGGTIRLSNTGKELHMLGLGKLKEGKTLNDVVTALQSAGPPEEETTTTVAGASAATTTTAAGAAAGQEEEDPFADLLDDIGAPAGIMGPGQKADITVPDFGAGDYALICFIPVEGGGPPHFAQGMVGQLTVVGDKAAEPTADATFNVETGKPVTGPATLTAGRHIIKFSAAAGSEQLEPGLAKLNPGATVADINEAFASFETEDDFVLPVNAASLIPGQIIYGVFDLGPARTLYFGVDLTAGTYAIDAHDSDPDDAPVDPVEKATFTVT